MKVLNVCETAAGGIGTYFFNLASMAEVEHVFVVPEVDVPPIADLSNLRIYPTKRRGPGAILSMLGAMRRYIEAEEPDVLFFHSTLALAALTYARAVFPRIATVYCAHGWATGRYAQGSLKSRLAARIEGKLCGLADRVVNCSFSELALAQRHRYRGNHVVIENAVAPSRSGATGDLFSENPDATHLLFVGRFDHQKGFDILLDAFMQARKDRPDIILHIVGASLRTQSRFDALPDGVHHASWLAADAIDDWYRSADALVVPSRWEGLPLVIPEAFRNGLPVLCSNRSGMDELVDDGRTGIVFDLSVSALADCLRRIDRAALQGLRENCIAAYHQRFSVDRFHSEHFDMLNRLRLSNQSEKVAV